MRILVILTVSLSLAFATVCGVYLYHFEKEIRKPPEPRLYKITHVDAPTTQSVDGAMRGLGLQRAQEITLPNGSIATTWHSGPTTQPASENLSVANNR
jgi:hypothetical protein